MISSLECVPDRLAQIITKQLSIPVVGIGSGPYTDGQALNMYDILGLFERFTPKFQKQLSMIRILQSSKDKVAADALLRAAWLSLFSLPRIWRLWGVLL